jgi:hypothetical protein
VALRLSEACVCVCGGWLRADGVMVGWLAQKASSLVNNNSWPSGWLHG